MESPRPIKKPTPFGKYYLLERINVGGMAEVFRAKAFGVEGFERLVAVKRILPNIAEDKEFIRMFIEEAKLSVQLNHANIAQIFDLGVVDGSYYIALEHVHGRDLRGIFDRCRQLGEAMPVAQACFVAMKVCEGLDYAHNKRDQAGRELSLVHRDVSPQNILVSFEGEVKLIDFGIAKAAGKGSKTQAGILKGKFGYMSPEQVRGLPIDRRSDVFSCGIVLYELLTGERLFVGESDFDTLEKVRNVEILPPSTYNRKIPDELERIVLKALTKDTDDRYQNAIDLHDELQAFVYTAGEFYSRKDLAGWMKKTFGKEIEEETAKLESYRQLKPPAHTDGQPVVARTATGAQKTTVPPPPRRATQGMPAVGTKPPPPPAGRMSQQMAVVAAPPAAKAARKDDSGDLAWDDDELETQIYDNPEDDPKNKGRTSKPLPIQAPGASGALAAAAAANEPDLSSLATTAKGWERGPIVTPPNPGATLNGIGTPSAFPTGSNKLPAPTGPDSMFDPATRKPDSESIPITFGGREISAPSRLVSAQQPVAEPVFDPMASFGAGIVKKRSNNRRGILMIAIGGAAVAAIAVVTVIVVTGSSSSKPSDKPVAVQPPQPPQPQQPASPSVDPNTGFDLYVTPPGVTQWKLDGESRTDRLPSRIRGIAPGPHTVQIDPPPGFMSQNQQVAVTAGNAPKVEITLQPIQGITGDFESTPPGATVSLIVDGKREQLGAAPAKAPLDPRHSYAVLFEKSGYVSVNRPIVFSGTLDEKIVVNLEKASTVATSPVVTPDHARTEHQVAHTTPDKATPDKATPDKSTTPEKVTTPDKTTPDKSTTPDKTTPDKTTPDKTTPDKSTTPDKTTPDKTTPDKVATKGQGTLILGSKPPCEIYIDGSATGLHTPQKEIKLAPGKHRITLMNNEFGIKETFSVDIAADAPAKKIMDYSDRLPK